MDFVEANFREGQRIIFRGMVDRVVQGLLSTGIVLHPRGGKSDLQRMITLWGVSNGHFCAGISVNINCLLRDQMGDNDRAREEGRLTRMAEAIQRYHVVNLKNIEKIRVVGYDRWPEEPLGRGEVFASFTIQTLIGPARMALLAWVESMVARKKPPIFFFDECQMLGGTKPWADLYHTLMKMGAYVVSMTGTPYREDGEPIPGFTMEVRDTREVEKITTESTDDPSLNRVITKQGHRTDFVLRGHIEVGLNYGWKPPKGEMPALCSLTRDTFDFEVDTDGDSACPAYNGMISQAPENVVKRVLGRALKNSEIIAAGVAKLIQHLRDMRVKHPKVKAIIFTGNDTAEDESNAHAKRVAKEVRARNPSLKCEIVTSSDPNDDDVAEKISKFNDGDADILIVKQAGGVGLDAPNIKVGLDLSTVRTYGTSIQRFLRIATPMGDLYHAVWICPDDAIWRRIWEDAVKSNNGEMSITKLVETDSYLVKKPDVEVDGPEEPFMVSFGGVVQGAISDSAGNVIEPDSIDYAGVDKLLEACPALRTKCTIPELVNMARSLYGAPKPVSQAAASTYVVEHSQTGIRNVRTDLNTQANRIAVAKMKKLGYSEDQLRQKNDIISAAYGSQMSMIWTYAKSGIVQDIKSPLNAIIDIDKLNAISKRLNELEQDFGS